MAIRSGIASASVRILLLQVNMVLLLQVLKVLSNYVVEKPDEYRVKEVRFGIIRELETEQRLPIDRKLVSCRHLFWRQGWGLALKISLQITPSAW